MLATFGHNCLESAQQTGILFLHRHTVDMQIAGWPGVSSEESSSSGGSICPSVHGDDECWAPVLPRPGVHYSGAGTIFHEPVQNWTREFQLHSSPVSNGLRGLLHLLKMLCLLCYIVAEFWNGITLYSECSLILMNHSSHFCLINFLLDE